MPKVLRFFECLSENRTVPRTQLYSPMFPQVTCWNCIVSSVKMS